ncbi:alpha/beta hydrolase [Aquabacterium fontiphilum]|jgi:acetyl esterase|uniref:alpha/beta hydrolase n=1 Tax=Aquabacterium fontiphilum TaxID=450365 RepID=UPI002ED5CC98
MADMPPVPPAPFTPATQALLDNIRRAGFPPIHTLPPDQARASYRMGVGAMAVPGRELARVQDFEIPGPAGALPARLWAASHDTGLPVFLYLHGGGFVVGGIDTCEAMCREIAHHSGAAVVAVDYRLAPEHKYPAGMDDCVAAFTWLSQQGHTLGLDGSRMAVGGDSAGGTLAAVVALHARDAGLPLALQVLFYPSVQLGMVTDSFKAYSQGTLLTEDLMRWFERQARGERPAQRWHREPLHAEDHRGVAPAWIGLAQCDALTDEGHLYAERLRAADVPVTVREWPGVLHDFINMGRFIQEAGQAHLAVAEALRNAFAR